MKPAPKPCLWPRIAHGPMGNAAMFQCAGDVPHGWVLAVPLPGAALPMSEIHAALDEDFPLPPKNKGGRPRKVVA